MRHVTHVSGDVTDANMCRDTVNCIRICDESLNCCHICDDITLLLESQRRHTCKSCDIYIHMHTHTHTHTCKCAMSHCVMFRVGCHVCVLQCVACVAVCCNALCRVSAAHHRRALARCSVCCIVLQGVLQRTASCFECKDSC